MRNTTDIIKGLVMRIDMNRYQTKNRKLASQLEKQLKAKFYEILTEEDDEVFFDNFMKLIFSQVTTPYIISNFFPESMMEYGSYDNIYDFSNDFKYEIRWIIASLACFEKELNDFIMQREKYDNYILINEYEKALLIVEEIQRKYGVSYWTMECRFFLNSKMGKDNTQLLKGLPNNVFGSILKYFELKNRNSITCDEYYYIAEKEIINARKHLKGFENTIEFVDYSISGNNYQSNPEKIMLTLSVIQRCSLIDRYLFIIKICNELMNQPKTNYLYNCMKQYIGLLNGINDDHLIAIRFVFDEEDNRKKNYILKKRLDNAKTSFISGDLYKARQEAISLLTLFPNNIGAMSLLVETNILIGDGEKQFSGTNLGTLLDCLQAVYTLNRDRNDAMEEINKLSLTCSYSTWAQSILSNVNCRSCENEGFDYLHHKILSNIQHLDVETIIVSLNKDESSRYIEDKLDTADRYVKFRKALLMEEYSEASELCEIEQIKKFLFVCDKMNTIEEKLECLQPIEGVNASMAILTTKEFLSTLDIEAYSKIAFEIAANLVVENIYTALFIPWGKIISFIDDGPTEIRQNICTPILYYVYAYYIENTKKDDLGIVCSDFFMLEDIECPSKMNLYSENYEKKLLVYFLKNICTPKIMDDSLCIFGNTQERDQERVEICNILSFLDEQNIKDYENEIREITQKLMINRELKSIDQSRIHVNVEGIRNKLLNAEGSGERFDKGLKNEFQRYLFYQDETANLWRGLLAGEVASDKLNEVIHSSKRLLKELVLKIRDAFVSSDEYGLNGYLSLNIRHGTLDDELRSPLYKSKLNVKKDGNSYIIDEQWTRYAQIGDTEILQRAFKKFYLETENVLLKLKKEYIQIRTEEKNEKGLFDYSLYDTDMGVITLTIENVTSFEEFFDDVINYFWKITERNLENIKSVIRTEIKQNYMDAFNELKCDVSNLNNKNVVRDLHQKINEAETDMQNVLEKICYWFQRSNESKHNDFDLQFAFKLGLQTIENMHPEKRFVAVEIEPAISDKIPGDHLKSYDGIFYNLFDNIYKKATPQLQNGEINIRYSLRNVDGKTRIYIENDYDCSKDISIDVERVNRAKALVRTGEYLEKVKGEGGTGIPKICKIITYDLNRHLDIDFGYKMDENQFFMEIQF